MFKCYLQIKKDLNISSATEKEILTSGSCAY